MLLAGARIIGCAPLQTLILGSGFGERPDGDDQASTRPLDTATLEPSPQTLEQFTLNFLAFRGVKLSRKTMQKALGLNKDQMTQLLDQLELSGKIGTSYARQVHYVFAGTCLRTVATRATTTKSSTTQAATTRAIRPKAR